MLMSVFKPPVFLPGGEPVEMAIGHLPPPPTLPTQFSSPAEMHQVLFDIYRWRFLYEFSHIGEEWTSTCIAFEQVKSLMLEWHNLAETFKYGLKVQQPPSGSVLVELQCAAAQSTYMRMMYTSLHYSATDSKAAREQHRPLRPSFADLSDSNKVVILVPIADSPIHDFQHELEEWHLEADGSGSHKRAVAPWPEVDLIYASSGKPAYVKFTSYRSLG